MVLAVKAIGSYWQLMAVLVSTLLPATIIGRYWQLKFLSVTWQLQMHLLYWVLGSYNYWHIDTVGSTWQLLIHHSTVNFFISEEDSCFKGCISRNAVKSSVISELFRKRHNNSSLDFPQELRLTACSTTLFLAPISKSSSNPHYTRGKNISSRYESCLISQTAWTKAKCRCKLTPLLSLWPFVKSCVVWTVMSSHAAHFANLFKWL